MYVNSHPIEEMIQRLLPELRGMLESAPLYGDIGFSITFYNGKMVRTTTTKTVQQLVEAKVSAIAANSNNNKKKAVRVKRVSE